MNRLALAAAASLLLLGCPTPQGQDPDAGLPDAGPDEAPRITGVNPSESGLAGGETVRISGDFFQEEAEVFFGEVASPKVTYALIPKQLLAEVPAAQAEGAVDVRVVNPDGREAVLEGGFLYVGVSTTVAEAKLAGAANRSDDSGQNPVTVTVLADVEVDGVTDGTGAGAGVRAQVGYMLDDANASLGALTWSDAQYQSDVDGASQGDLARDRYGAQLSLPGVTGPEVKRYLLAARFSVNDGLSWTVADLDGSSNGSHVAQLQRLEVSQNAVDWCKLGGEAVTAPPELTLRVNQAGPVIYAQVYEAGVTDSAGQGTGLTMEIGYGPEGSDPEDGAWTWSGSIWNVDTGSGSNDEYQANLPVPAEGTYAFAFRAAVAGGPWRYCDADGSDATSGYDPAQAGRLVVTPLGVDRCRLQFPTTLETREGVASSNVYGWVWAAGVTDAAGQGAGITAEVGYGPDGTPASDSSWTWTPATYNTVNGDKDSGQADEYEGTLTGPTAGTYDYAFRFSLGAGAPIYCDLDGSDTGGYTPDQAGALTSKVRDVDACQLLGPSSYALVTGASTPAVLAQVTGLTITEAMGAGAGITAEIGYGPAGSLPSTWTWSPATFDGDQGPADRYTATASPPAVGTHKLAYRFRYQTLPYVYCDLDGSPFDEAQAATVTVGYACQLRAVTAEGGTTPLTATNSGDPLEATASLLIPGVTDQAGAAPNVLAQVGLGTEGTDASSDPAWGWMDAAFVMDDTGTGEDVWGTPFHASYTGTRAVSFRFSTDSGASWTYCDLDGNANGYSSGQQSALLVNKHADLGWCNLQSPPTITVTPTDIYGQVYAAGVTDMVGNGGLVAEWGYGNKIEDPALAWTWAPAAYNVDVGNNDEFMASFTGMGSGTWHYAFRYRRAAASSPWCYGDLDGHDLASATNGFNGESSSGGENLGVATVP